MRKKKMTMIVKKVIDKGSVRSISLLGQDTKFWSGKHIS